MNQKEYLKKYYIKHKSLIKNRAREYYQRNKEKINNEKRNNPSSMIPHLRVRAFKNGLSFEITPETFRKWYDKQKKECVYCGIPIERLPINDKDPRSTKRLSIDRKNNKIGYEIDNIVFSCVRCNFIKSDILSYKEMKEIGQKYFRPRWQSQFIN